jgi:hypothetical protein
MGCGESDSAAGVATGPSRPERRIAPLTATGSSGSQARGYRGATRGDLASAGAWPFSHRRRTSLASSRKGLATRSRAAVSTAIARRLFRAPPVSPSALS